jgi:hypothetical protein
MAPLILKLGPKLWRMVITMPRPLYPPKTTPGTYCIEGRVGPRTGLDLAESRDTSYCTEGRVGPRIGLDLAESGDISYSTEGRVGPRIDLDLAESRDTSYCCWNSNSEQSSPVA